MEHEVKQKRRKASSEKKIDFQIPHPNYCEKAWTKTIYSTTPTIITCLLPWRMSEQCLFAERRCVCRRWMVVCWKVIIICRKTLACVDGGLLFSESKGTILLRVSYRKELASKQQQWRLLLRVSYRKELVSRLFFIDTGCRWWMIIVERQRRLLFITCLYRKDLAPKSVTIITFTVWSVATITCRARLFAKRRSDLLLRVSTVRKNSC